MSFAGLRAAYILLIVGFFASANTAHAGDCGYGHCFGAIGLMANDVPVHAVNIKTADLAVDRLSEICGGNGCRLIEVFNNGCAAMARQSGEPIFSGFSFNKSGAEEQALNLCELNGGTRCFIVDWACTR